VTSLAKIEANRRNAVRSTGPNTANGKSHSRFNALRGGVYARARLLPGEDAEAHEALTTDLFNYFEPVGPMYELLTGEVIDDWWRLGRMKAAEDVALRNAENLLYLNDHENTCLSIYNGDAIAQRLRAMIAQEDADKAGDATSPENVDAPLQLRKRAPLGCTMLASYAPRAEGAFADLERRRRGIVKDILRNSGILIAAKESRQKVAPAATIHELRPSRRSSRIPRPLDETTGILATSVDNMKEDVFPDVGSPARSPQIDGDGG